MFIQEVRRQQMEKKIEANKEYSSKELSELKEEIYKSYDDQLKRITEMVILMLVKILWHHLLFS